MTMPVATTMVAALVMLRPAVAAAKWERPARICRFGIARGRLSVKESVVGPCQAWPARDKVPAPAGAVNDGRPTALARRTAYAVWVRCGAGGCRILPDNREKPDQTALFTRI